MFYAVRVNVAIAALGINPSHVNQVQRQAAQMLGQTMGHTPQEVALLLLTQMPFTVQGMVDPRIARGWAAKRKINIHRRDIDDALCLLGWLDLRAR
jgi:hypothetical protein